MCRLPTVNFIIALNGIACFVFRSQSSWSVGGYSSVIATLWIENLSLERRVHSSFTEMGAEKNCVDKGIEKFWVEDEESQVISWS